MVKYLKTVIFFMGMFFFSCENFLTGPLLDQNPNEVDDVTVVSPEALLVGTQVTMYGVMEGYLNRAVSFANRCSLLWRVRIAPWMFSFSVRFPSNFREVR